LILRFELGGVFDTLQGPTCVMCGRRPHFIKSVERHPLAPRSGVFLRSHHAHWAPE
jgi:hypothetical protein